MKVPESGAALSARLREAAAGARAGGAVRVVLGNEAADLDSMACAVAYALLLDRERGGRRPAGLPLINIPRADLALRPEAVRLFRETGLEAAALSFRDGFDVDAAHAAGRLRLVLVDHNRLAAAQAPWADAVEEIVDHHADEGLYPGARRLIAPVGSCATLVAERLFASPPHPADPALGRLLLGAILLDTVDLDPAARKVTARDEAAARRLLETTGEDRRALFGRLQAGRSDLSALGSRDLLRRDYKEYPVGGLRYGISSVPLPLREWAGRDPALPGALRAWAMERGLDLLLVMSVCPRPRFHRELAVYARDRALRDGVVDFLDRCGLGLSPLELGPDPAPGPAAGGAPGDGPPEGGGPAALAAFAQADPGASRKRVQPLLEGYLKARG